jgi:hypothetical protein
LDDEDSEIGRSAFSCSISDWNPDWDKMIETSYQTDYSIINYGTCDIKKGARYFVDGDSSLKTYSNAVSDVTMLRMPEQY